MELFESVIRYSFSDFCIFTSSGIYKPTGPLMQAHRLPYASSPAPLCKPTGSLMQAHRLPYGRSQAAISRNSSTHSSRHIREKNKASTVGVLALFVCIEW